MRLFLYVFLILCSMFFISCEREYSISEPNSIHIPPREDPYMPEKKLPKEMQISGKYTFTTTNKSFQFDSTDEDWYCYKSLVEYSGHPDEGIIPIRFRLYDEDNKLLRERLPFTNEASKSSIIKFFQKTKRYPDEIKEDKATVWTHIPYHKDGVKIKAILVDDEGKDLKVLAERGILPPEEFRERFFYKGCYRQVGLGIE